MADDSEETRDWQEYWRIQYEKQRTTEDLRMWAFDQVARVPRVGDLSASALIADAQTLVDWVENGNG